MCIIIKIICRSGLKKCVLVSIVYRYSITLTMVVLAVSYYKQYFCKCSHKTICHHKKYESMYINPTLI